MLLQVDLIENLVFKLVISSSYYSVEFIKNQSQEMDNTNTVMTLIDLPIELHCEIFKRCDYDILENLSRTCRSLRDKVQDYINLYPKLYKAQFDATRVVLPGFGESDDNSDEEDYYNYLDDGEYSDHDDLEDILGDMQDRLSFGSNYDEELHDFLDNQ